VAVEEASTVLTYLDSRWYALPARHTGGDAPATVELCAGGLAAAYFRIGGRTFNSADLPGPLSYQGTQRLATLAALTDYDRNKGEADKIWAWESWKGHYDWTAGTLRQVGTGPHRWHLDQLVILRGEDRIRCGYITRVALDNDGELTVSLRLWPGSATAIAVRALTAMLVEEPPAPALTLSASPDEKGCIVVPPRTFSPGRVLLAPASGPDRRFRLTRLIQRGAAFERAAFEEVAR